MNPPDNGGWPEPFTVYVKISSENRVSGGWFYDLETARQHAKHWESIVPVTVDLRTSLRHRNPT